VQALDDSDESAVADRVTECVIRTRGITQSLIKTTDGIHVGL